MRVAVRFLTWAAGALGVAIALAIVLPFAFGGRPYTVLSGSMQPAIAPGDVVISTRIDPADARPGDVVTFRDPQDPDRLITHRVRSSRPDGSRMRFVTKGDANNTTEEWRVAASGHVSRVSYRVPAVGRLALAAQSRGGLIALVLVPLLLLGGHEIARIWRPAKESAREAV
jgi:signal peptidase I